MLLLSFSKVIFQFCEVHKGNLINLHCTEVEAEVSKVWEHNARTICMARAG